MGEDTVCDRCAAEIASSEAYEGKAGTEWEGCNLCPECQTEVEIE